MQISLCTPRPDFLHSIKKLRELFFRILTLLAFGMYLPCAQAFCQLLWERHISNYDTTFVENHNTDLAVRLFGGYRFSGYKLDQRNYGEPLTYKSNDNFNLGIGINYRFIGLSLGVKAPFVNNDEDRYGKTKMFDLQSNLYLRKFTIDIFTQFYKGYYVKHSDIFATPPPPGTYILRPDLKTRSLGVHGQYIFNYKRFSYRAAYVQDEYQLKSAGSPLAGLGVHHYLISADSAIIPRNIAENGFYDNSNFNKSQVFNISVDAGYVHTLVIHKHFFITGALLAGTGINITSLTDDAIDKKDRSTKVHVNGIIRLAAGYNSGRYFAGLQYIDYISRNATPLRGTWQEFETGSFRLTLARRFKVHRDLIQEVYNEVMPRQTVK